MILALLLTVAACACLYGISPNQRWRTQPLPKRPLLAVGLLLLTTGSGLWMTLLRPLAGAFVALHVVMACLFIFPYLAALPAMRRELRHGP